MQTGHQGLSWSHILLHLNSEGVGAGGRSEHEVSLCVHVSHLTQHTPGGADDVTASLRHFDLNL